MCILYDHLRVLSRDIANSASGHWEQVGVVVPPQTVKSAFTTGNIGNILTTLTTTHHLATAKSALHGTCISIHQNLSSNIQQVENLDDSLNNNIKIIINALQMLVPLLFVVLLGDIDKKCLSLSCQYFLREAQRENRGHSIVKHFELASPRKSAI